MIPPPPRSTLFPYTTLFRSVSDEMRNTVVWGSHSSTRGGPMMKDSESVDSSNNLPALAKQYGEDRKSTRLNSSHLVISYAVFCLKKKKKSKHQRQQRIDTQT